jgi:N-acetylglucosamine transport system permease protein
MIQREKYKAVIMFLAPAVILYAGLFLLPMARAFYIALFRWRGLSAEKTFVGLENFRWLAEQVEFRQALLHNGLYLVASFVVIIPVALLIASLLARKVPGAGYYRAIFLFPNMISVVAIAVLWSFVYHPTFGIMNALLKGIGMGHVIPSGGWLGDPKTTLPCIIVTNIWYSLGFYIVLFLAGMQSIPKSFYEAASIDGATGWQQFKFVTIPLLWEVLKLAVVYLIIQTINVFGMVWVMREDGAYCETVLTYLYRTAIVNSEVGRGTAVGVVVFAIILTISLISMRLMKREAVEY